MTTALFMLRCMKLGLSIADLALLNNWEGRIEHGTVFEEVLAGLLHLDYEALAVRPLAIDIENGAALAVGFQFLRGQVSQVFHYLLRFAGRLLGRVVEQGVKQADKQVLVQLRAEKLLESEIGVGIHVFLVFMFFHNCFVFEMMAQSYE